ncbi:RNA polymerase sigma factor [Catenovulum sp. 2E275]|uniref:RNA polymerase sigma factor n=1 Tax=Catenovulum sp. 2E275 TaxID=2980497 RepID=UPI0021D27E52|nr:RNA polymerase sigma factor [Catenovulum sp. 2E275]MCU4677390.1 RNA polymerase sigma factor [Catenovulum sp. 2E275]
MSIISRVFIENSSFLKAFLTRFLKCEQDIEDVVQEVYLKARNAENNTEIQQPKAFLFSVAKNLALNELNRKSRQMTAYIDDCISELPAEYSVSIESEIEAKQSLNAYCQAIDSLPDKCKKVYLLRKVHGLSRNEIAERMDLSVSSVQKYLKQGIEHCSEHVTRSESPKMTVKRESHLLKKKA